MKLLLVVSLALGLLSTPALAQYKYTGNALKEHCDNTYVWCLQFIAGVYSAMLVMEDAYVSSGQLQRASFCPDRANVTFQQVTDITRKYMQENPEVLHRHAGDVTTAAIYLAFPCE